MVSEKSRVSGWKVLVHLLDVLSYGTLARPIFLLESSDSCVYHLTQHPTVVSLMLVSINFSKTNKQIQINRKGTSSYGGWLGMELTSVVEETWLLSSAVKGTAVGGGGVSEVGSMEGRDGKIDL